MAMAQGYVLSPPLMNKWNSWTLEEAARQAVREWIVDNVGWLLDQIPDDERAGMTVDKWLDTIGPEDVKSYRDLLKGPDTIEPVRAALAAIVSLFSGREIDVHNLLGLPIGKECERRIQVIADNKAKRKADAAERAENVKTNRQKEVADLAVEILEDEERERWLNTPQEVLDGRTPLEAAYHGFHGAAMAKEMLRAIQRERQGATALKAETALWRQRLKDRVERRLSADVAKAFLKERDADYGRATALIFCRDERTFRIVLRKLDQWVREFGDPF